MTLFPYTTLFRSEESQNLSHKNVVAELTTLTKTQEPDMVPEAVSKDSPNLANESPGIEPTPIENQDQSTSTEFVQPVFVSGKKDSCVYMCCYKCYHGVHVAVHEAISKFWISHVNCSTIEDMHGIVTSYGLSLVSAMSKWHASQSTSQQEAAHSHSCPCDEKFSRTAEFAPRDCECHMPNDEGGEEITLRFLFRDGVLIPIHLYSDVDGKIGRAHV